MKVIPTTTKTNDLKSSKKKEKEAKGRKTKGQAERQEAHKESLSKYWNRKSRQGGIETSRRHNSTRPIHRSVFVTDHDTQSELGLTIGNLTRLGHSLPQWEPLTPRTKTRSGRRALSYSTIGMDGLPNWRYRHLVVPHGSHGAVSWLPKGQGRYIGHVCLLQDESRC
jgi:hypothetical protein